MTKLNSLLNYLIKNAFYEEANYLFKLANNQISEDEMKTRFPNIWDAYDKSNRKPPFVAWAQLTVRLINKYKSDDDKLMVDEEINNLIINNFNDLKEAVSGKKTDPRIKFLDEVKKEVGINISDEELLYAREKGLTTEETIFLVEDKTGHPFLAKVDWAFKFNQNKHKHEDLKDKNITNYQNIDEVDRALSDKITYSAEYMKNFYEGIKSKAEETSKVIYNSLNYVVSHSKSKEAAQWWEQSCVSYDPKTKKVDAGLCTARHEGNLYNEYYSDGYLIQIITKSSPSSSTSPKTNFKDKNYSWNLISLHIYDDGELSRKYGSTINRLNQDVTPCEIKDALGDEYNEIIEAISGYFNENFNTQISGFDCEEEEDEPNILKLIKKDELNERDIQFLKDLSPEDYFNYKLDIKFKEKYTDVFDKNYRYIGSISPLIYFQNNLGKYRDEKREYLEPFENALNEINALSYFELKLDKKYKKDYLNIFERNLNEINSEDYFELKLDEEYGEKYPNIYDKKMIKKISDIPEETYFEKKFDEEYGEKYDGILSINLERIDTNTYFGPDRLDLKYAEKYPGIFYEKLGKVDVSIVQNYLLSYLKEYNKAEYPNMFQKIFDFIIRKLREPRKDLLNKFKEIYQDKNALKTILTYLEPSYYFYNNFDEEYKEYTDVFEEKIKMISAHNYFKLKLDERYKEYTDILEKNKEYLYKRYYYKYIELNRHVRRHIAEKYYDYNIDKFFEKYYPELSEKINNKFKEQIEND